MAQLVGSGYLETAFTNVRTRGEQVYSLTQKWATCLTPIEQVRLTIGMPGTNEMRQQLDAHDARVILEHTFADLGQQCWIGSKALQYQQQICQDMSWCKGCHYQKNL